MSRLYHFVLFQVVLPGFTVKCPEQKSYPDRDTELTETYLAQ